MAGGIDYEALAAAEVENRRQREAMAKGGEKPKSVVEKDEQSVKEAEQRRTLAAMDKAYARIKGRDLGVVDTAADVGQSVIAGAEKGIVSTPGAPFDIIRLGQLGKAYTDAWRQGRPTEAVLKEQDEEREAGKRGFGLTKPSTLRKWGGQGYIDTAQKAGLPGIDYEPKTATGEVLGNIAETGTGALSGGVPGMFRQGATRLARRAGRELATGVTAGTAAEVAGGLTDQNPWAKGSAALIAGPLAASRGAQTAEEALRNATRGTARTEAEQVETIFRRATMAGVPVTRSNILDMVTQGRTSASELQRVVESMDPRALREFFANHAERTRQFGQTQLDRVGPVSTAPSTLGPRMAQQGDRIVEAEKRDVNADVRNMPGGYADLERVPVDPAVMGAQMGDRHWAETAQRVLDDSRYANLVQTTAQPGTVGFMQLVNRVIQSERDTLLRSTNPGMNPTAAQGILPSLQSGEAAANTASRQLAPGQGVPPTPSPLEVADQARLQGQQQRVDPLEMGPEGQLARSTTTQGAQEAIFPSKPLEGQQNEIGRAVQSIAQRDPRLATEFVRNYLGTEFSQATGRNVAGEPYTGGAKFSANVAGDQQQRLNLEAAITNLPNGQARWEVFNDMLEIFNAMGQRQAPGSKTAPNIERLEQLKGGTPAEGFAKFASGGFTAAKDAIGRWRLGKNMDELADLITNPARGAEFERIVTSTAPGSVERAMQIARFVSAPAPNASIVQQEVARPAVEEPGNQPLTFTVKPRKP